jgi:DNA-binding CsgD family transcriptional regulator
VPPNEAHRTSGEDQSEGGLIAGVGLIGAVAQWCECLHGREPLLRALEVLGRGLNAEIVALARYSPDGRGAVRSITWDRGGPDRHGRRTEKSFARALIGPYFEAARPGSLWFRSIVDSDASNEIAEFHASRHLCELAVIPLDTNGRSIDTFELHFHDRLRNQQQVILNGLAPMLAQTWRNRAEGLFTEALLRSAPSMVQTEDRPILSAENPARLSRAEYRVSLLLSRGLSIQQVKDELRIRDSTLRSHLSNLYAKTSCSNLSELVFCLASSAPTRNGSARQARPV